jgi:hypothetical protein
MSCPAIPPILAIVVARIAAAVPARARATFLDLLLGAAITKGDHVTDAILAISRGWSAYYWLLENARWSWLRVCEAQLEVLKLLFHPPVWYAVIPALAAPAVISGYAKRWAVESLFRNPQARLWPEGRLAAVASGADALGQRAGGRLRDPADAGLHQPRMPGRLGRARPLARSRHPHRRSGAGRHRPDFARGRAACLHRGDPGKNRRRCARHKRIVSAARRQSRLSRQTPSSSFRSRGSDPAPQGRHVAWKLQKSTRMWF